MSLREESAQGRQRAEQHLGENMKILDADIARVNSSGLPEQALQTGQTAPDFTLPDAYGKQVSLSGLLAQGPVILSFYSGEWCPFCNLELSAYQRILPQIAEMGATFVAIFPEKPDFGKAAIDKNELTFPVLSDGGNKVARLYGLAFEVGKDVRHLSENVFKNDIAARNVDNTWQLPVPGTFVIDMERIVRFRHVDADYITGRVEPEEVLQALHAAVPVHHA